MSTNQAYFQPRVAMDESERGGFIITWTGHAAAGFGGCAERLSRRDTSIYAQRFNNAPFPTAQFYLMQPPLRGGTFRVNEYTPSRQWFPEIAVAPNGRFVVVWQSLHQDASGEEIAVRLFDFPGAGVMKVDDRASGGASNVNGVLEAGERVTIDPAWRNSAPATEPLPLTGSASNPTGATRTDVHAGGFRCRLRNDRLGTHERLLRRYRQLLRDHRLRHTSRGALGRDLRRSAVLPGIRAAYDQDLGAPRRPELRGRSSGHLLPVHREHPSQRRDRRWRRLRRRRLLSGEESASSGNRWRSSC